MGLIHGAVVGQRDQVDSDAASVFAQALGDQPRQEILDMTCERIDAAELLASVPNTVGADGARSSCWQA